MNRRIVLIDQNEVQNVMSFYGCGLGNEIYTIQSLQSLNEEDLKASLTLGPTDAVMLVGGGAFKFLQQFYHFGVRSENYFDCSKLTRLSIEGGAFVKVVLELPKKEEVEKFMDPSFTVPVDFSWFKYKVIHTFQEAVNFLNYLDSLPENQDYGFDYEASGMPLEKQFEISGAAICTEQYGGFISFTDLRHNSTQQEYYQVLELLGKFLVKRMSHVWTYNMQYEFQVSHRMLGVDLYNLCDASVYNVLDGYHLKKYSLKWTAQRILGANVWDTEFDYISDLIDSMLFEEVGRLKAEKHKVLKVTKSNFKDTSEWKELCKRYPEYINEFESLILEYWGNAFMPIPSEILGKYCNLDAFYTLMIHKKEESMYTEDARQTFLDNIRLGARLHSSGLYIDEPFRLRYEQESLKLMAYAITYNAEARCWIKMEKHSKKMNDLSNYNPVAIKLLKDNKFFNGDTVEICKHILSTHIDTIDAFELGVNEGLLMINYGEAFAVEFLRLVRESMEEAGMIKEMKKTKTKVIKQKIEANIVGKKKFLGILADKIKPLLGIDKIDFNGDKHLELEKYLYYERAFKELTKISLKQLNDINNIPDKIYIFGKELGLLEYSDFISENYFKCKSPIENDEICLEMAQLYKSESAYLAAIFESTQQLPGAEEYYKNLGIETIDDAFKHFMIDWEKRCKGTPAEQTAYPEKVYKLALEFYRNPGCDQVKEVWSNFNGYIAQEQFFKYVSDQYLEYGKPFDPSDLKDTFFFMRKFVINYLIYKKYAKVLSTYINGMFKQNNCWVIESKDHIPIRYADPGEPGAVEKCFVHYEVNTKSSKRWSSGFHTIISHADLKDCIRTPYHLDDLGNIIDEGFIETYFDINEKLVSLRGDLKIN